MRSLVSEFASDRLYRSLFWDFAAIGPWILAISLAMLLVPSRRRSAALGLLACIAGAIVAATVFHFNYALVIWRGHDSAIRYLDQSAFFGGYAASAVVYVVALVGYAASARLLRRSKVPAVAPPKR
jgi:hypothetical protein